MTVKELIEDLQKAPADSQICFQGNGMWVVTGIEIGKMPGQKIGYVMLGSNGKGGHDAVRIKKL